VGEVVELKALLLRRRGMNSKQVIVLKKGEVNSFYLYNVKPKCTKVG
jgi:hypothetical protein